jgi:hypothetical protein
VLIFNKIIIKGIFMGIPKGTPKLCSVQGCEKKHSSKGYCKYHYHRIVFKKYAVEAKVYRKEKTLCIAEGCNKFSISKDLCSMHYQRNRYLPKKCAVEGCEHKLFRNGFCLTHFPKKAKPPKEPGTRKRRPPGEKGICDADDCNRDAKCRGYCSMHYERLKRHGDVNANYKNKCKRTKYGINKSPVEFTNSHEELMIINEFFDEMIGVDNPLERYD